MIVGRDEYLSDIGATTVVRSRVEELLHLYESLVPESLIEKVFISEIRDSEGQRVWQSLWVYGPRFVGEAMNFLSETKCDGVPIAEVNRWEFEAESFTPGTEATDRSRLRLHLRLSTEITGQLSASGKNCEYLYELFTYVVRASMVRFAVDS
jgi:hypothetical protein